VLLELARERGATLEDIFVRLTTHDAIQAADAGAPEEGAVADEAAAVARARDEESEPEQEVVS
jgi:hypothetical protein